jgi:hypothetical protein
VTYGARIKLALLFSTVAEEFRTSIAAMKVAIKHRLWMCLSHVHELLSVQDKVEK